MFTWDSWSESTAWIFVLAIVCLAALGVVTIFELVLTNSSSIYDMTERELQGYKRHLWIAGPCCFVIVQGLVLLGSWLNSPEAPEPTAIEEAAVFGLQSGKAYDLVLGAEQSSDEGTFFTDIYLSSKPAHKLAIGFAYEDKSYILVLPFRKVTFVQSTTADPSAVLYISPDKSYEMDDTVEHTACDFTFRNLYAWCAQPVQYITYTMSADGKRRGLAPIVARHLDSATITLTPAMYSSLLGRDA
ncbi:MAG TPA: hypothetical protein VGE30_01795 [Candidatus Saccharimonadales bacterium]